MTVRNRNGIMFPNMCTYSLRHAVQIQPAATQKSFTNIRRVASRAPLLGDLSAELRMRDCEAGDTYLA